MHRFNVPCISFSVFLNVQSRNFILWCDCRVGSCLCVCGGGGGRGFVVLLLRYKFLLCKSASWSMNKVDTVKCSFHTSLELNSSGRNFFNVCINVIFFVCSSYCLPSVWFLSALLFVLFSVPTMNIPFIFLFHIPSRLLPWYFIFCWSLTFLLFQMTF